MIGATVKAADAGQTQLILATGEDIWVPQDENKKIKTMHPSSISGVDDMVRASATAAAVQTPRVKASPSC